MEDKESYLIAKETRKRNFQVNKKMPMRAVTEWRVILWKEKCYIRTGTKDWAVLEITRQAFYNLYVPGCVEHYLVHIMREHEDFISNWILFWS